MGQLTEAVNKLDEVKSDLKAALEEKGATVGNATLREYPNIVRNIVTENPVKAIEIDTTGTWTKGSVNTLRLASITPADATVKANDYLNKGALTFSSSNNSVVKVTRNVNSDGVASWQAEVVGFGEAVITASLGGKTATLNVSNPAPANSLYGLQAALSAGTAATDYPIGHEFDDNYAGNSNPMIVAHYGTGVVNGQTVEGVYLVRKFVEPTSQIFGSNNNYSTSTIKGFLDTTYLNNCSDELKDIIANISVPSMGSTVAGKMFLMSDREVCSNQSNGVVEGEMWDYWKQKTGLTSPSYSSNDGRIMKDRNGSAQRVWLRSPSGSYACLVDTSGSVNYAYVSNSRGVLPACFVAKP